MGCIVRSNERRAVDPAISGETTLPAWSYAVAGWAWAVQSTTGGGRLCAITSRFTATLEGCPARRFQVITRLVRRTEARVPPSCTSTEPDAGLSQAITPQAAGPGSSFLCGVELRARLWRNGGMGLRPTCVWRLQNRRTVITCRTVAGRSRRHHGLRI